MQRLWVVCYDVSDDRRRYRLDRWLSGQGDRVLESVFECVWRGDAMHAVRKTLASLVNPAEDALSIAPVCAHCREASVINGQRRAVAHVCFHVV